MKNILFTKKLICTYCTIIFCAPLICGCSQSNNRANESNTQNWNDSNLTSESEAAANPAYEKVFSDELEADKDKIVIEIWNNSDQYTDGQIKINNQEFPIDPESESAMLGYAHTTASVCDLTNDGKEEIILIASGGASGSVQSVQVFENVNETWHEMDMPSGIYDKNGEPLAFVTDKLEELNTEMAPLVLYNQYRNVSFENDKIFIDYPLWTDTDSGSVDMGIIRKEISYSMEEKKFILGDTLFLPAENN